MRLPFSLRGLDGVIDVAVDVTREPETLGASPGALGLPHCQATIDYPGRGYAALFGWVQLVRSTDNAGGGERFEMDPLLFVGEVAHPFAFFGINPTLFDAPARRSGDDLDWVAHSFLCHLTDLFEVRAITGFGWGFRREGGSVTVRPVRPLEPADWKGHLELLHGDHPQWRFAAEPG